MNEILAREVAVVDPMCPICRDDIGAAAWQRLINRGIKTHIDMAEHYNVDPSVVHEHVRNHAKPLKVRSVDDLADPAYAYEKIFKMLSSLEDWYDDVLAKGSTADSTDIDKALRLSREFRESLKLLADLQGKLGGGQDRRLLELTHNYRLLVETLMMEGCDECKEKVLGVIESVGRVI